MTNLPKTNGGLPAKIGQNGVPEKKDFKATVAALRKASGKAEYRIIPMRCAVHDLPYVIVYKRTDPLGRFRIEKITKETSGQSAGGGGLIARYLAGDNRNVSSYDCSEFDTRGRHCPWCQDKGTVIHCGDCGETYCGGSTERSEQGPSFYRCVPRCGSSGHLSDYGKTHGKTGNPKLGKRSNAKLLSGKKTGLLEAPDRLRLPRK